MAALAQPPSALAQHGSLASATRLRDAFRCSGLALALLNLLIPLALLPVTAARANGDIAVRANGGIALPVDGGIAVWANGDIAPPAGPPVVLLHGLTRSAASMSAVAKALTTSGFRVCNVGYPSRHYPIEVLAADYVAPAVARCFPGEKTPIDFVTHSMGGIIVRQLAASHAIAAFGRVVMLGPPNGGSELVDELGDWWIVRKINGPAGAELGTSPESLPRRLGPASFEVGIVAGNRSYNLFYSRFFRGENDGKVSVASAELEGMKDFVVIPVPHAFLMRSREAIRQTIAFLRSGVFAHGAMQAARPILAAAF